MKRQFAIALMGVLALTACSDSPDENLAAFCDSHDSLVTSVESFGSLSAESTSDDVDAVRDDVETSWAAYEAAAEDVSQDAKTQAEAAYSDYLNAISVIPGDAPISDRVEMTIEAANVLKTNLNTIAESVTCE
jgi:hypothetical protein